MLDRQRLVTYGISTTAAATVALALWLKPWATGGYTSPPPQRPTESTRVHVVIAVDTPEDVDAALYDAVHKMQWRDGAKKMIFLVGDAPPASRGEVPRFEETALVAAAHQIVINTVRCGGDTDTANAWQQIASIGH